MKKSFVKLSFLAVLLALMILIAACSDAGDDQSESNKSSSLPDNGTNTSESDGVGAIYLPEVP